MLLASSDIRSSATIKRILDQIAEDTGLHINNMKSIVYLKKHTTCIEAIL